MLASEKWVKQFIANRTANGSTRYTIKWYAGFLNRFAQQYPELPADPETLERFIFSHKSSDERRHAAFRALRAFYNYIGTCVDDFNNPFTKMRPPKRLKKTKPSLTLDQLKTLLEYPLHRPRIRALLYFLADTGARLGEAANLKPEYIHLDSTSGHTLVELHGKTGVRIVPVSDIVSDMLLELHPEYFPQSVSWLTRMVSQAFKTSGLKGTAHTLRHTFCTLWEGQNDTLQTITGHTSLTMLQNYRHNKIEHAVKDHSVYSPLAILFPEDIQNQNSSFDVNTLLSTDNLQLISKVCAEIVSLREENSRLKTRIENLLSSPVLQSDDTPENDGDGLQIEDKDNQESGIVDPENCIHHWIIDSSDIGKCKFCGAQKDFKSEIEQYSSEEYHWRNTDLRNHDYVSAEEIL